MISARGRRVEIADCEECIIGPKSNSLQTLTAAAGVKPATPGVRRSVLKLRKERDLNRKSRYRLEMGILQERTL
jgi:hypothetical protein